MRWQRTEDQREHENKAETKDRDGHPSRAELRAEGEPNRVAKPHLEPNLHTGLKAEAKLIALVHEQTQG